jgi:hypothetical protein
VLLLQYAYSDSNPLSGTVPAELFKKFAVIFGPSIADVPLRQAMLAFTAASASFTLERHGRTEIHWSRASGALMAKSRVGFSEADLFAAALLTVVACGNSTADKFTLNIHRFITIMNSLVDKSENGRSLTLSIFWPAARDFILEGSRYLPCETPLLLSFVESCRRGMGSLSNCLSAFLDKELFGAHVGEYGFGVCMWKYVHLLRRCFSMTAGKQAAGDFRRDERISATVAEVKDDLQSPESLCFVDRFMALRVMERFHQCVDAQHCRSMFIFLMYRFCQLLIALLEGETILAATLSTEAISAATETLLLIPSRLTPAGLSAFKEYCVPRILSVVGLVFPKRTHPDRTSSNYNHLITLVSKYIVDRLEMYEHWMIAGGLKEFWESGDITLVLGLLRTSKEEKMLSPKYGLWKAY